MVLASPSQGPQAAQIGLALDEVKEVIQNAEALYCDKTKNGLQIFKKSNDPNRLTPTRKFVKFAVDYEVFDAQKEFTADTFGHHSSQRNPTSSQKLPMRGS